MYCIVNSVGREPALRLSKDAGAGQPGRIRDASVLRLHSLRVAGANTVGAVRMLSLGTIWNSWILGEAIRLSNGILPDGSMALALDAQGPLWMGTQTAGTDILRRGR